MIRVIASRSSEKYGGRRCRATTRRWGIGRSGKNRRVYAENRRMTLAMTMYCQYRVCKVWKGVLTVQSDNAEDEDHGQGHNHYRVNLQTGRLISV
jgi:hypothetical protein